MKIKLLLFVLLGGFITMHAQTTAIPDANFEQFLIDQGYDSDGLINGSISNLDAEAVTELITDRNDIIDFTGLEAFVNLTKLNVGANKFSTLPLGTLIALEELRSSNNHVLTSLDLSANTALRFLYLAGSFSDAAPLTTLDLSNNVNLEDVDVSRYGNLTSLEFPTTNTLTRLDVGDLSVSEIDISQLAGLESLTIDDSKVAITIKDVEPNNHLTYLNIRWINVTEMDISKYIALESLNLDYTYVERLVLPSTSTLKRIDINGHNLQGLVSFANVPQLENLTVEYAEEGSSLNVDLDNNTALKTLELNNNYMISLDITKNVNLTSANLYSNKLTEIDLTKNIELSSLNIYSNELTALDVTKNTKLWSLNVHSNQLSTIDLTNNTLLDALSVAYNNLEELDISNCIKLHNLTANNNLLSGNSIMEQYHTIRTNDGGLSSYDKLIVSNNKLSGTIPDFSTLVQSNYMYRFSLAFDGNAFQFGDFENEHNTYVQLLNQPYRPESTLTVFDEYKYAPQAKVDEEIIVVRGAGEGVALTTTASGEQNHYQWFKEGVPIPDAPDSPIYELPSSSTCDTGNYTCEVTSDLVPFDNEEAPGTDGKNLVLERNRIILAVKEAIMECVSLTAPLNGDTDVPIDTAIEWNDDPGACGYRINVGTTSGGTNIVDNLDMGNVTIYNFEEDLPANTQIFVTITPYDGGQDQTGCMEESFTTYGSPECTSLLSPLNNATDVPIDTKLEWKKIAAADGYRLSVGTTSGGTDILNNEDVGKITTYNFTENLPEETAIFVTIVPYNLLEDAMACTEKKFITGNKIAVPDCATLVQPQNGETNVEISAGLKWGVVETAVGYRLSVGTISGEGDIVNNEDVGNITFYDFTDELPENTHVYVSITPYNEAGEAMGCMEESFTTEELFVVPDCTSLVLPLNGSENVPVDTQLQWNTIDTATGYNLSVGTTSGGTDLINNLNVGNITSYSFTENLPKETTIYVSVIPYNEVGVASECNEEIFTTGTVIPLPRCPSLVQPQGNQTGVAINTGLQWKAVAEADGYLLSVGTTSNGNEIINNENVGNATTYNFTDDLPEDSIVYVHITPYNEGGQATGCNVEVFATGTVLEIPNCTTLVKPLNNATEVPTYTDLIWAEVPSAEGYRLSVGTTSGGTNLVDNEDLRNTTFYSFTDELPENTTIYINIIPYNSVGDAMGCTETSFTTEKVITVPSCTSLIQPINNSTDISVNTNLEWATTASATGYRLSVGTTSAGTDLVADLDVGNVTLYSFTDELPENTTIYVSIIPYNSVGDATGCTETSFTTEKIITVPSCTSLIQPINNSTDISVNTNLEWATTASATGYRLSVGTTYAGTDLVADIDVGNVTSYSFTDELPENTTIYVNIIPYNSVGDAMGCTETSFTTEKIIAVPNCTELILSDDYSEVTNTIKWKVVPTADGYKLGVGSTPGGSDYIDDMGVGSSTSYNFSSSLPENTTIYIRITPYNETGDALGCSETSYTTGGDNLKNSKKYGISPNNDGLNDYWEISGIENHPNNMVSIYNRWGDKVFEVSGYDNQTQVFSGVANKKSKLGAGQLPNGTYFYNISINEPQTSKNLQGFIVLKR